MAVTDPIEISFVLNSKELTEDFKRIAQGAKNPDDAIEKLKERFTQLNAAQLLGVKGMEDVVGAMKNISTQAKSAKIEDFGFSSENIEIQKKVIAELELQLKQLQKTIDSTAPGKAQAVLKTEAQELQTELSLEKEALIQLEDKLKDNEIAHQSLASQVRGLLEDMRQLELQGKANTEEYEALKNKAAELDEIRKRTRRSLQGENADMRALTSGVSALAGGLSAAQGTMALFAGENENLQKIMLKVQSLMAVSYGLQQVSEALDKRSAFATVYLTKVKEGFAKTNARVATSLNISNAAAKALLGTLTLGLAVGIPLVISLFEKWNNAAIENAKLQEDIAKKTADALAEPMIAYRKLQKQWEALKGDLELQKKFIGENVDAFKDLGVEVNSVSDAEKLLADQTGNFVKSMEFRAKATAAQQLATEKYKEALDKQAELEADKAKAKDGNWWQRIWYGRYDDFQGSGTFNKSLEDEIKNLNKLFEDLMDDSLEFESLSEDFFEKSGLKKNREAEREKQNQSIKNQISDREKAWQQYYQYEAEFGAKAAKRQFAGIKSEANSFFEWLNDQKESLSGIIVGGGTLTTDQQEQFEALTEKINELSGQKSGLGQFSDDITNALENVPTLVEQLDYLDTEIKKLEGDSRNIDNGRLSFLIGKRDDIQSELKNMADEFIATHKSIEEQKVDITNHYAQLRQEIEGRDMNADRKRRLLAALKKEEQKEIQSLTEFESEKEDLFSRTLKNITALTKREMKIRLQALEEYFEAAEYGLTESQKAQMQAEIERLKSLLKMNEHSAREKQLLEEKKELLRQIKRETEDGVTDPDDVKRLENINKELNEIFLLRAKKAVDVAGSIADGFRGAAHAIGDSNSELADMLDNAADGVSIIEDLAYAVASFYSGEDIAGGISSLISAVGGIIRLASSSDRRRKIKEWEYEALKSGLDYNEILRERLLLSARINESYRSRVAIIKDEIAAAEENLNTILKDQEKVIQKLLESNVKLRIDNPYIDFAKVNVAEILGLSPDELGTDEFLRNIDKYLEMLAELNAENPFSGDTLNLYEDLLDLIEEAGGLEAFKEQWEKEWKDIITGTTAEGIADSIIEGLREGKRSFEDFGDDIEDILRNAILAGVNAKLMDGMVQPLQDFLFDALEDGPLTEEDIEAIRDMWNELVGDAVDIFDALDDSGLGLFDTPGSDANSLSGAYKAASQESIDLLSGNTAALRLSVIQGNSITSNGFSNLLQLTSSQLEVQMNIENNTLVIANNTQKLHSIDNRLQQIMLNGDSPGNFLAGSGLTL